MRKLTLQKTLGVVAIVVALGIFFRFFTYPSMRQIASLRTIPRGLRTNVYTTFVPAHPESNRKAKILFTMPANHWGYDQAQFKTKISGELIEVHCLPDLGDPITFDPNSEDWDGWLKRLDGVFKQAETGLKPEAEEFLRKEALKEKEQAKKK